MSIRLRVHAPLRVRPRNLAALAPFLLIASLMGASQWATSTSADEPLEVTTARLRQPEPLRLPDEPPKLIPSQVREAAPVRRAPAPVRPLIDSPAVAELAPSSTDESVTVNGVTLRNRPLQSLSWDISPKLVAAKPGTPSNTVDLPNPAADHLAWGPTIAYGTSDEAAARGVLRAIDRPAGQFCYRPLYFEELNVERYGRHHGHLQPLLSGVHFFASVPALPYKMTEHHPCTCYDWKYPYPAGRSAPKVREFGPIKPAPAGVEAAFIAGLWFLFL